MIDLLSSQTVAPSLCLTLALVVAAMTVGSLALVAVRWRRLPAPTPPPLEGVVGDDLAEPAAEVIVEQDYEARDGFTRFCEVARHHRQRAFSLVVAGGQRVVVPADERLRLWWPLDGTETTAPGQRRRSARVAAGARVFVHGVVVAGGGVSAPFRDEPRQAEQRGVIALVHPALVAELTVERRRLRRLARGVASLSVLSLGLTLLGLANGNAVTGRLHSVLRDGTAHARVVVEVPNAAAGSAPRTFEVWSDAVLGLDGTGQPIALRQGPWPLGIRLGAHPGTPFGAVALACVIAFAMLLATLRLAYRPRLADWRTQPPVIEPPAQPA